MMPEVPRTQRGGPGGYAGCSDSIPPFKEIDMPQGAWSDKRERQYKHIKEGAKAQGRSEKTAERIAAATVNKDRARAGESETASPSSLRGPSPERPERITAPTRA